MNSSQSKMGPPTRATMPAFGAFPSNQNASMLLGRSNAGVRRSTPDSEALASSDDELEQTRGAPMPPKVTKNTRRTSWLYEIPSSNRKASMTASGPYSPSGSHPATPSGDSTSWNPPSSGGTGSTGAWNPSSNSYPWGAAWNNENRNPAPSRLQEVLHSPTAIGQPPKFLAEDHHTLGGDRSTAGDASLPFAIPMQPTPKTYRSQSYSVGQIDTGAVIPSTLLGPGNESVRTRGGGPLPSLQRRSSRTGALGERLHDSAVLDQVEEVEDDEETPPTDALAKSQAQIEQLQRENADLRKSQELQERQRVAASTGMENGSHAALRSSRNGGAGLGEGDVAIEDNGEDDTIFKAYESRQSLLNRGQNEQDSQHVDRQPLSAIENRNLENARRAHWQTQHFETGIEPPQSRRHSFADIPTRHGSFSSSDNTAAQLTREQWWNHQQDRGEDYNVYGRGTQDLSRGDDRRLIPFRESRRDRELALRIVHALTRENAAKYFRADERNRLAAEARARDVYGSDPYGRPRGIGSHFGGPAQPLFVVTFKCYRSDIFYIQEGTGLQVNVGDLVMVEADRGTDLGSVQHANVSWEEARNYKEYYAEEHYKLLMMFSEEARNGGPNSLNPNGLSGMQSAPGSAVGGMGPPGHHGHHEASHTDIKPKMIRRLAQNHEIESLKEKERNEAKAKRVCRQKVGEHRLTMEVLDAEFQMDQKKLTFYYFAEKYINFNSLVTDLFKIYKTRIWMSAINPASFITPTSSLAQPIPYRGQGLGGRDSPAAGRRQQYGLGPGIAPSSPAGYDENYENGRGVSNLQGTGLQNPYFNPYQTLQSAGPQVGLGVPGYGQNIRSPIDPFTPYIGQSHQMFNPNARDFAPGYSRQSRAGGADHSSANDWTGRFQGLSLGS